MVIGSLETVYNCSSTDEDISSMSDLSRLHMIQQTVHSQLHHFAVGLAASLTYIFYKFAEQ